MNIVLISSDSRYPIHRKKITKAILDFLDRSKIEDAEVSVRIVGLRKIKELNKKWRNLDEPTTVLTFGLEEPRDGKGILRIGDIVICYPLAREIAIEDELTMDLAIEKLLLHGMSNLLGSE